MIGASPRWLPNIALVGAVLGVSTSGLFIRLAESPPLAIAAYRMVFVTAILVLILALRGERTFARIQRPDVARLACAGLFLSAHFGLWTTSLSYTSVASAVVLVSTHPAFVAVAEVAWLGRTIPPVGALGIGLTMLGGLVIASGEITSGQTNLFGCALAVGGALSMVGYLLIGRTLRARLDSISYSTAVFGISGLTLLLAAWLSGASLLAPARDVPLFLALALFPTIGGHTMFNWALRHLPASVVSTSFLGEPIGASLLAWLFLGEIPATMTLLGGSVIIVGLFLTMRSL